MSGIDGPGKVGGASIASGVERASEAQGAEKSGSVEAATNEAIATGMEALFDQVAAELQAGHFADRSEAIRAAVDGVLAEQMGHLAPATRGQLAAQIADVLSEHPGLSTRLDRLLNV